uniref:Uncharacterized protein n=1 Tax=Panagrolaimus sp. PS1159 TaxID=55785 RepID=A0AC35FK11_9BILA
MAPSMIEQNVYFILHCYQTESIMLYDTNLTATINNCFTDDSPYQCIIKEQSFVLYQMNMAVSAIKLSSDLKSCVFQNNVFMHKTV